MMELDKIHRMDCLEGLRRMEEGSVDLVATDPPYNIGIAEWDKKENYHEWLLEVFRECARVLKENGTLWFFHISFTDLVELHTRLVKETPFRHKQLIIIDKGLQSVAGRCNTDALRSFPRATEYLQFYTFEDITGAEQLSDTYTKINPMAKYLKEEFERAGVSNGAIQALFPSKTGGLTGCISNWLLGYNFPTKEQYEKMRHFLNYEYLRKEYEDLRKEYEELRYPFNLPLGVTDVWPICFYVENNNGHPTAKPLKIIQRIVSTASKEGDLVLDPFAGSGTTAVACRILNRRFIGFEISEEYYRIAEARVAEALAQRKLSEFGEGP